MHRIMTIRPERSWWQRQPNGRMFLMHDWRAICSCRHEIKAGSKAGCEALANAHTQTGRLV